MNYKDAGLRESEYLSLKETLGREPNDLELRIMGVMWSARPSAVSRRAAARGCTARAVQPRTTAGS